jgi:hypothetical protein
VLSPEQRQQRPQPWVNPVNGSTQFDVFTGVNAGGSFTPDDEQFDVIDQCT